MAEYTTSEQAAWEDDDYGTEFGTTSAVQDWITSSSNSVTIDAGNRLVIDLRIVAVGTMGGSQTATVDFDDSADDVQGDSFIHFPEQIRVDESQAGSGTTVLAYGHGVGSFEEIIDRVQHFVDIQVVSGAQTVQSMLDDLAFQRDNQ